MDNSHSRLGISHHFRREAKLMAGIIWVGLLLGILAAVFAPKLLWLYNS